MKSEIALHRQGECHTCSTELSLKKVDLANEYIEQISSQPQNIIPSNLGLADRLVSVFYDCHKKLNMVPGLYNNFCTMLWL